MNTWYDLIQAYGGPYKFAETIGVSEAAALQMSSRNSVHSRYWAVIVARASHAGVEGITLELLASLETGRAARQRATFLQGRRQVTNQVQPNQ